MRANRGAQGPRYHPPFPRFPTPRDLGMGVELRGKNRKVRFTNAHRGVSQTRGGANVNVNSLHEEINNHNSLRRDMPNRANPEKRPRWRPTVNGSERPRPPPPPPLRSSKSATSSPNFNKRTTQYKVPKSPEEEKLRLSIISAVKEMLRGKKLDKKMFKFVCKHCSLNVFSILSEKKDISKPEKMIHQRMAKIKKLVDEECERVLQCEKAFKEEKSENAVLKNKLKSEPFPTDNPAEIR